MKIFNKTCKLFLLIVVATIIFFTTVSPKKVEAATYQQKTQEYRAVWVSPFVGDIPRYTTEEKYKADFNQILDNMEKWGFNAMVFHVRTHNNALYKSSMNPLASWWSEVDFDVFDPLAWSIEACHARGIEFHAWMNPYRITTSGSYPAYSNETTYPEGNPANDSSNFITVGNNIILDPGIPTNRDFIVDSCMELVENYDVDAIHFDDYFYISGATDDATRAKYNTENLSVADFRRQQVDLFIEQLHNELVTFNTENNKAVELGISPSGVYKNGSYDAGTKPTYDQNGSLTYPTASNTGGFAHYGDYLYSDTKYWIDQEWIDYITPQTYHAIGNQYSSFSKLTEWWNWVVEYKKVNLSMGVGIYMAIDNAGGWTSANELYNQMLNANEKENIAGLCFYKYGSLLSTTSNMVSHVNALQGFWTKKVPSAVKPQHTNLPEPMVTGINLDGTTLSWNNIDGVRGYVIWKVAKSTDVDTNNIDHLYDYIQTNQIEVEEGYDYYVSSVNLANELSEPVSSNPMSEVETIISKISAIQFPVTLSDETNINTLLNRYNNLSEDLKQQITNYQILVIAHNQIQALKSIDQDAQAFVETLKTDVLDKYLLPLSYNGYSVSWDYNNQSDSSLYNIQTGEVLVEFLGTTYVDLKCTMSKDGISHSFSYKLNVGYTKTTETGLFYRNTPNALNKLEDTSANVSFIGWCGHVMKFSLNGTNYVYFPAVGNCFELTSSDIPSSNWTSCGNLYYNATSSTIKGTGAQFGVSAASDYGYFIIGSNGLVRYTTSQASESETISLNAGEYLYCVKYLDSQISGSVMKPASKISVGTKVEVLTPVWSTDETEEELASQIIEQINLISSPITLAQKNLILRAKALYDNATASVQSLVTNYNVLENAIEIINELDQAEQIILTLRENAKNEINNYLPNLNAYSENNQNTINSLISIFNSLVETKTIEEEINSLVIEYKGKLDEIKTIVEEDADKIDAYREQAILEVESYYNINDYSLENQAIINKLVNDFKTEIMTLNTLSDVDYITLECKNQIALIPSLFASALKTAKDRLNEVITTAFLSAYNSSKHSQIKTKVAQVRVQLNSSKSVDEINSIMSDFEKYIEGIPTIEDEQAIIEEVRNKYIPLLENRLDLSLYSKADQDAIKAIIEDYKEQILADTSAEHIKVLYLDACSQLDQFSKDPLLIAKKDAVIEVEDYANNSGIDKENVDLIEYISEANAAIDNAKSIEDVELQVNNFKVKVDTLKESLENTVPKPDENPSTSVSCLGAYFINSMILTLSLAFIVIFKKKN